MYERLIVNEMERYGLDYQTAKKRIDNAIEANPRVRAMVEKG